METTLVSQLLDCYRLMGCDCLMVKFDKMFDAQTIDVGIITDTLRSKVFAEVYSVGTNLHGKLHSRNVVL